MDSCSSVIGDWSIVQLEWLDDQGELYVAAFKDHDLSFFSTVNQLFLDLWPVRVMLWPSKPTNQRLTNAEQRRVYEAEDQLKMVRIVRSVSVRSSLTVITSSITAHQIVLRGALPTIGSKRLGYSHRGVVQSPAGMA